MDLEHLTSKTKPLEATLFLTSNCNFLCEGCKRQVEGVAHCPEMTLETVKRVLATYPQINGFCVAGLGEPTLCPQFEDIVNYLTSAGKYVGIVSNGSNAESFIALKNPPGYLSISLYGYDRNSYIDNVKLDIFDKVISNFALMRKHLPNIGFSYFINKNNYKQLPEIIHLAQEAGADFLHITNYLAYDISENNEIDRIITVNDKGIIAEIDSMLSCLNLPGARPVYVDFDKFIFSCPSYKALINVNGAGDVSACQRQIPPSSEFGNIYDSTDWYNAGRIQECRTKIKSGQYPHDNCKYCFGKMGRFREMNLSIGIFVLFHEKLEQTLECINSFLPYGIPIYILNNGSSSQAVARLLEYIQGYNHVELLNAGQNLGVGVGRNYLIEHTKEEWLFFVDNDIVMQADSIVEKIYEHIIRNPGIEVFIPALYNIHENSFVNFLEMFISDRKVCFRELSDVFTNYFPGGASVVNRSVFQRCGLYDEKMFIGLEDMELALRAILLGSPIKCKIVDDLILHHNHKTVTASDDKNAVITRYDMSIQEKSYKRILEKYSDLEFDHSYQEWVVEQQTKMTQSREIDLTFLTPLKNFGASTPLKFRVDFSFYSLESALLTELVTVFFQWYPDYKEVQFLGSGIYAHQIQEKIPAVKFFDSSSTLQSSISASFVPESYDELEQWRNELTHVCESLIVAVNILERLSDPRPFLASVRKLLFVGHKCVLVVEVQGNSSETVTQESYWRQWTSLEIRKLLMSGGFTISRNHQFDCAPNFHFIEIQADCYDFELFLKALYLPPPGIEYLVMTQEHSEAIVTGGIGSYVAELERVVPDGVLALLLIGSGDLLPDQYICKQNRYFYLSQFLGSSLGHVLLEEAVTLALEVILFLYNEIKVVEFQDVNGKGYRFIQGVKSGFYPSKLMTQVVCHASRISLEKAFQIWIDPADKELFEEKYVIENVDVVKFPTRYISTFYNQVGYSFSDSQPRYERLPFTYSAINVFESDFIDIDTLIFFGKRNSYKGFDIFTKVVRTIVESGRNISRILLIGPRCDEMVECNSYFDEVATIGISVEEYSLKRSEALALIANNVLRSICVIPYKADNHPYSVLEIINSCCPMIVTCNGGMPELIPSPYSMEVVCPAETDLIVNCFDRWAVKTSAERRTFTEKLRNAAIHEQNLINHSLYPNLMNVYAKWRVHTTKLRVLNDRGVTCLVIADCKGSRLLPFAYMLRQQTHKPEKVLFLFPKSNPDQGASKILDSIGDSRFEMLLTDGASDSECVNEGLRHVSTNFAAIFCESMLISNNCLNSYLACMEYNPEYDYVTSYAGVHTNVEHANFYPDKIHNYLGEGVFISQINNILGHTYGLFRMSSLLQFGGFPCQPGEIVRGGWSSLIHLVSNGCKIGVVPRADICMTSAVNSYGDNYSDQYHMATATSGLGRFESFRLQSIARWLFSTREENLKLEIENQAIAPLEAYARELECRIKLYHNSLSWKLTRPLRLLKKAFVRLLRQ